jgi:hypothetical protein
LNQGNGEIIQNKEITTWTEITHIYKATQLAYESINSKAKVNSQWKENIMKKVQSVISSKEILIKARDSILLPEKVKKGQKIMREFGLVLECKDKLIDAISRLTEKAAIYQRKLDIKEKRREFSEAHRNYELQRSQFYREIGGDEKNY